LAQDNGCTPAQAVYRVAQLRGVVPLAGSTNQEHMKDGVETSKIEFKQTTLKSLGDVNNFINSS
jgi:diketogulonate reductase-like aldo/keto reductase